MRSIPPQPPKGLSATNGEPLRLLIRNLHTLTLPETLGNFGHRIHLLPPFLLLSFVCFGYRYSVTEPLVICVSHIQITEYFIGSCFVNQTALETLFLQRCKICHHFWHSNTPALLNFQYSWKKRVKLLFASLFIRLQIRETTRCISHANSNKPVVLGSFSLKTQGSNSSGICQVQA